MNRNGDICAMFYLFFSMYFILSILSDFLSTDSEVVPKEYTPAEQYELDMAESILNSGKGLVYPQSLSINGLYGNWTQYANGTLAPVLLEPYLADDVKVSYRLEPFHAESSLNMTHDFGTFIMAVETTRASDVAPSLQEIQVMMYLYDSSGPSKTKMIGKGSYASDAGAFFFAGGQVPGATSFSKSTVSGRELSDPNVTLIDTYNQGSRSVQASNSSVSYAGCDILGSFRLRPYSYSADKANSSSSSGSRRLSSEIDLENEEDQSKEFIESFFNSKIVSLARNLRVITKPIKSFFGIQSISDLPQSSINPSDISGIGSSSYVRISHPVLDQMSDSDINSMKRKLSDVDVDLIGDFEGISENKVVQPHLVVDVPILPAAANRLLSSALNFAVPEFILNVATAREVSLRRLSAARLVDVDIESTSSASPSNSARNLEEVSEFESTSEPVPYSSNTTTSTVASQSLPSGIESLQAAVTRFLPARGFLVSPNCHYSMSVDASVLVYDSTLDSTLESVAELLLLAAFLQIYVSISLLSESRDGNDKLSLMTLGANALLNFFLMLMSLMGSFILPPISSTLFMVSMVHLIVYTMVDMQSMLQSWRARHSAAFDSGDPRRIRASVLRLYALFLVSLCIVMWMLTLPSSRDGVLMAFAIVWLPQIIHQAVSDKQLSGVGTLVAVAVGFVCRSFYLFVMLADRDMLPLRFPRTESRSQSIETLGPIVLPSPGSTDPSAETGMFNYFFPVGGWQPFMQGDAAARTQAILQDPDLRAQYSASLRYFYWLLVILWMLFGLSVKQFTSGTRFMIPAFLRPKPYDYHRRIVVANGRVLPDLSATRLFMTHSTSDPDVEEIPASATAESVAPADTGDGIRIVGVDGSPLPSTGGTGAVARTVRGVLATVGGDVRTRTLNTIASLRLTGTRVSWVVATTAAHIYLVGRRSVRSVRRLYRKIIRGKSWGSSSGGLPSPSAGVNNGISSGTAGGTTSGATGGGTNVQAEELSDSAARSSGRRSSRENVYSTTGSTHSRLASPTRYVRVETQDPDSGAAHDSKSAPIEGGDAFSAPGFVASNGRTRNGHITIDIEEEGFEVPTGDKATVVRVPSLSESTSNAVGHGIGPPEDSPRPRSNSTDSVDSMDSEIELSAQDDTVPVGDESYGVVDCVVCMDTINFPILRSKYMVTPCDHLFHTECLQPWLSRNQRCPICRMGLPSYQGGVSSSTSQHGSTSSTTPEV